MWRMSAFRKNTEHFLLSDGAEIIRLENGITPFTSPYLTPGSDIYSTLVISLGDKDMISICDAGRPLILMDKSPPPNSMGICAIKNLMSDVY